MKRYEVSFDPNATADLTSIRDYISTQRGREFADAFVERIVAYCERFRTIPHRGTRREDVRPGLRTVGWRRAVSIAFQVFDDRQSVIILAVLYRGQDVLNVLKQREER